MKVTVDANIFFSCFIKKGVTRRIWFNPTFELYAPEFMLIEYHKYKDYIIKKFDGTGDEFKDLFSRVASNVNWVSDTELAPFMPAAKSLTEDQKDLLYIACALKEDTILWSNDKGFKKQRRIIIRTTKEIFEEYGHL